MPSPAAGLFLNCVSPIGGTCKLELHLMEVSSGEQPVRMLKVCSHQTVKDAQEEVIGKVKHRC